MAFPIPSHLPRKDQDVSTKLLSKMSETSFKTLTHEAATSWVAELNVAIKQTKDRIHERIQTDLPAFEAQLASSKSVQERLQSLSSNVDALSAALSHPEVKSGLVPQLITNLTRHAALTQEARDADVKQTVLSHLAQCKTAIDDLKRLVQEGHLPEAMAASAEVEHLLSQSPSLLQDTNLLTDLKRTFRAARDRTDEQLNDAYSRGVVVTTSEIVIRPSVQVRASERELALSDIVKSLSPSSLSTIMGTLRRNITSYYISRLLTHPALVEISSITVLTGDVEHKLTVVLSPPHSDTPTSRIDNLSTVLTFLHEHLFPHLPPPSGFPLSLSKPVGMALLNELLIPSLPSKAVGLPEFLQLLDHAVAFERVYIGSILGDASKDKDIKVWGDAVAAHYERKRRVEILEHARTLVVTPDNSGSSFFATVAPATAYTIEQRVEQSGVPAPETGPTSSPDSAWDFDEDASNDIIDEDGWGFEDEPEQDTPADAEITGTTHESAEQEVDPDDAWGWKDDDEQSANVDEGDSTDSSAWDDPWGETDQKPPAPNKAKTATRLEKLTSKGKQKKDGPPSSAAQSPVAVPPPPPTPATSSLPSTSDTKQAVSAIESYLVSGHAKELLSLVENVLVEAADLAASGVLKPYTTATSTSIGHILYQVATQALELYRALCTVAAAPKLSDSPKLSISFSNDCFWISEQVQQVASRKSVPVVTSDRLREAGDIFQLLSESWYEETLSALEQKINSTLDKAEGFVGTTDQDRYDECEDAVNQVLKDIHQTSHELQPILRKSKYYEAIGTAVNAALSRLLADILALPDITEVESHKLCELCRILNALESLFVEDPSQPSFVVAYVPSWLKFSYLSELLEASIADISYLFEEGALVDFEIQELVNLVRALFADTPLRANTVNKLMQGHPPVAA